ncbi:hypothetical protein JOB18_017666 [Solea senegalensis]|uniref:Uncharacterized protein n=1 Tax=Solea senegalensis TaxID=28829 RepID=A0AAV6PBT4_SOLSE|nr:hypothetical protein JOB18_017666 [Solea senegalensis]
MELPAASATSQRSSDTWQRSFPAFIVKVAFEHFRSVRETLCGLDVAGKAVTAAQRSEVEHPAEAIFIVHRRVLFSSQTRFEQRANSVSAVKELVLSPITSSFCASLLCLFPLIHYKRTTPPATRSSY